MKSIYFLDALIAYKPKYVVNNTETSLKKDSKISSPQHFFQNFSKISFLKLFENFISKVPQPKPKTLAQAVFNNSGLLAVH